MESGFPIRNLDTGEVISPSMFDGLSGLAPSNAVTAPMATEADNNAFRKLFAGFGKDDLLYHALKCRLWESLSSFHSRKAKKRHQGIMFISSKHLSFAEENAQRKPVKIGIPLHEIVNLSSEDFGLSEGIVVSTMRDTKFYFEQFASRREAFDATTKVWKAFTQPQQTVPAQSTVFDPLGGFSAISASPAPAVTKTSPTDSSVFSPVQKPLNPATASQKPSQPPPMWSPPHPQPLPTRAVPPPPSKRAVSDSKEIPIGTGGKHAVYGVAPLSAATSRATSEEVPSVRSDVNVNQDFLEISKSDSWFLTLTKIYYRLGKFGSVQVPEEYLNDKDNAAPSAAN